MTTHLKKLLILVLCLLLVPIVYSLDMSNMMTVMNQYTGKPDWIRSTNQTGEEYTFENLTCTNLEATNLESNLDGTGYNITADWGFMKINWSDIQNKFITAVDDVYIYMSGTTATLNETKLNDTIMSKVTGSNTSMKSYVDAQDVIYNDSMKTYTDNTFITLTNEGNLNVNHSDTTTTWDGETSQADLSVNSSTWWADVSDYVTTYFMKTGNNLDFNETKLNETIQDNPKNWTKLQNYPTACPSQSYLTQLNDSVTCTSAENAHNSTAWDRTGTDVILANIGDDVGIGTASPSVILDIESTTTEVDMEMHRNQNLAGNSGIGRMDYIVLGTTVARERVLTGDSGDNDGVYTWSTANDGALVHQMTLDNLGSLDVKNSNLTVAEGITTGLETVDNANDGHKLSIDRTAAEGDSGFDIYTDSSGNGHITYVSWNPAHDLQIASNSNGGIKLTSGTAGSIDLNPTAANNVSLFQSAGVGENRHLRQGGYITEVTDEREISWQISDIDNWFNLWRETTDIEGFKVNMPLEVSGNLIVGGNKTGNEYYGGMYMHNDSGLSETFNSTYQKLYFDKADNLNGFTFTDSTLSNIGSSGMYQVIWKAEGTGTNNHEYHGYVYINELRMNNTIGHAIGSGNSEIKMDGLGFIRINTGDNITLRLADLTSSAVGNQIDANLNLVRIGN